MTARPRVCTVLVNWTNWIDTVACLESLAAARGSENLDIVVVENGSANDSCNKLVSWIAEWRHRTGLHSVVVSEDELLWIGKVRPIRCLTIKCRWSRAKRDFAVSDNLGLRYAVEFL